MSAPVGFPGVRGYPVCLGERPGQAEGADGVRDWWLEALFTLLVLGGSLVWVLWRFWP